MTKIVQPNTTFVVTFSGGKDSVANWLHLQRERGLNVVCLFADTGWESQDTYDYLDLLESKHSCPLVRVSPRLRHLWAEGTEENLTPAICAKLERAFSPFANCNGHVLDWQIDMRRMVILKGRPPSATARFCTTILKLRPMRDYVLSLWNCGQNRVVIATGIRDEEGEKRASMPVMSIDELTGRPMWKPIKRWPVADVFAAHKRYQVPINPHYFKGCSRVGCWPCIFSRKDEIAAFSKDPAGVARLKSLETDLGQTFFAHGKVSKAYRSDIDPKTGKRINWADDVIRWALGEEPALQRDGLFAGEHEEFDSGDDFDAEVCSSVYGLCE